MSLEDAIVELTEAIKENTQYMKDVNLNYDSSGATGKSVKEEPVKTVPEVKEEPKPVAAKKPKPVAAKKPKPVKKKEPEPAPVNTSKPPVTFAQLKSKVIKWIGPLAKNPEREEEAQEIMQKLLDKFAGGKLFTVEDIKPEYYQNILDYIEETKLNY